MPENLLFASTPLTEQPLGLVFGEELSEPNARITDLVFTQLPKTHPTALVFGESDTSTHPDATLSLATTLPGLAGHVVLALGVPVALQAVLPGLAGVVVVLYQSQTQRPTVAQVQTHSQIARVTESGLTQPQQHAQRVSFCTQHHAQDATGLHAGVKPGFAQALWANRYLGAKFQDGSKTQSGLHANWSDGLDDRRVRLSSSFQEGNRAAEVRLVGRFEDGLRDRRVNVQNYWSEAVARRKSYTGYAGAALPRRFYRRGVFQEAWVPRAGIHLPPVSPDIAPVYWGTALLFACPPLAAPLLLFGLRPCEIAPIGVVTVPVRKVYFVINDVTLIRVADGAPVPVLSLSLSLDASSWTWGFDAVLPLAGLGLVESDPALGPTELMASVNGAQFRLLVETISRERSFGESSIHISGRGHNAVLSAPYAPVMTFANAQARTARQLMDDVLTFNGVAMGWSVDWGLTDWNVLAGVFAHQGTWIEALSGIAAAAGGYLMPHPTDKIIRVRHRYPVAPWEWGAVTPDFVLPVDAVQRESLQWLEKPAYNRVFVSGQETGVLAQVTRAGTAGDVLAPMVVDALITDATVARQRGMAVLADTGRQIEVSLRMPVLLDTGIIQPGSFVQYQDGSVNRLGLVRSTSVQAGFPEVWQTLGVQAYA